MDSFLCDPGEIRTLDPLIKSQLPYQLSDEVLYIESNVRFIQYKNKQFNVLITTLLQQIDKTAKWKYFCMQVKIMNIYKLAKKQKASIN